VTLLFTGRGAELAADPLSCSTLLGAPRAAHPRWARTGCALLQASLGQGRHPTAAGSGGWPTSLCWPSCSHQCRLSSCSEVLQSGL